MPFPADFIWGAAAAAYQIEGAAREDGRGLSIWDVFCEKPGAVWQGHTGDVACDHYHRYREDVALMKELGLQAYRFSIGWPRVLPRGVGQVNARGLDFYNRLVDELLAADITPCATLFHWDFPHDLFTRGGWLNRDSADWFAEYTSVVRDALADRVAHWMTLNEPNGVIWAGHEKGIHAPGLTLGPRDLTLAIHNILRAHGKAVSVLRDHARGADASISFVYAGSDVYMPVEDTAADRDAARSRMFGPDKASSFSAAWWMDPVYLGSYPAGELKEFGSYLPATWEEDLKEIHQPLDVFSFNCYRGHPVEAGADGKPVDGAFPPGAPTVTGSDTFAWPLTPQALYWGPIFYHERYGLPIMVTENGMSSHDWVAVDGTVPDYRRIDYLNRYLDAFRRAGEDGVDIRGYFLWSILDNFEWSMGYRERFGMVYVDYQTQQRTPKASAWWYRDVIACNGASIDLQEKESAHE